MKRSIILSAFISSLTLSPNATSEGRIQNCEGFLPENSRHIPDDQIQAQGIKQKEFNDILDRLERHYAKDFEARGAKLVIERRWTDGTVNAYASQEGNLWYISMYGGFARHPEITADGFALIACHETGHHLGGAPKYDGGDWASNEGQADYYATTKCLKRLFEKDDNEKILAGMKVDPTAVKRCEFEHRGKQDQLLCIRVAMAGASLAGAFADLSGGRPPKLDTPDQRKVSETNDSHPASQCRMDTYFQGSLCREGHWSSVSDIDYRIGYCADERTYSAGLRPRCWFAPQ